MSSPTVRMLPPVAATGQNLTVNGRNYASTPGHAVDAPDMDAAILGANGWTRVALSGPTTARPTTNPNTAPPYVAAPGVVFYDTTLSAPVIFDGATWRTFAGASA